MSSIFAGMDYFRVWRDAEALRQAWGPIEYAYPHVIGDRLGKGTQVGVLLSTKDNKLKYGQMTYGLRTSEKEKRVWSAIAEDLLLAGSEMEPLFQLRRCLIPADSWTFTQKSISGLKRLTFQSKDSGFCFAGLYSSLPGPNGTRINSVARIDISSLDFYRDLEDRMPALFLPGPEGVRFLNPKTPIAKAWELIRNFPLDAISKSYE